MPLKSDNRIIKTIRNEATYSKYFSKVLDKLILRHKLYQNYIKMIISCIDINLSALRFALLIKCLQ